MKIKRGGDAVDLLRRWIRLMAAAVLLCCVLLPGAWAAEGETGSATILFTHDLHSSFLPRKDGSGGTTGGYARLASALKEERAAHPGALTVDGGDFSVGSLIQALYTTQAAELRTMGAMGYDAVVGIMCSYVATQIGFGTSWQNPFSLAVAQGISGLPVMSGAWFRVPLWIIFTAISIIFTMRYAKKIKKNPKLSVAYESDEQYRKEFAANGQEMPPFTLGHKLVILTVAACMAWTIWGVVEKGYYIPEIASQFFVMGLVSGIIGVVFHLNGMRINDIATSFDKGAADLLGAAICVGMAQGIIIVLGGTSATDGTVLNTILHAISEGMQGFPPVISAWFMYIFQSVFNFFVVSGSGQAALTMPIMAPLADLVGIERQVAVLAFQLGDAFTNFIVPTSGCLLGALAAARLDWGKWAKFQIKFQAVLFVCASAAVVLGVLIGLS